jgi:ATP-dependent Clp protease ATP-binding subunit ClpC
MNGYNFTERVRKVLAMAREESVRLHHEYVGTEHILLGLLREGGGVAAKVLEDLGVDPDALHDQIEASIEQGRAHATGPDLPYTSRAKKVLELAMSEARDLGHSYVGTEHLLLGLIAEHKGIAVHLTRPACETCVRVTAAADRTRSMTRTHDAALRRARARRSTRGVAPSGRSRRRNSPSSASPA